MPDSPISFNDGAAYEEFMGLRSRLAGDLYARMAKARLDELARRQQRFEIMNGASNGRA